MLKKWLGLAAVVLALAIVGCGSPGPAVVPEDGAAKATQEMGKDNQEQVTLDPNNY